MKKGTKKVDFSQVIEAIKELKAEFKADIETVKTELRTEIAQKANICPIEISKPIEKTVNETNTSDFPIPQEYRDAVNEILNNRFGIKIVPSTSEPSFLFQLLIPKEYSNAGEQIWTDAKADIRSKVVTYGEGVLGVKTYIELVKSNLGPDINALIVKDKENGK